MRIFRPCLLNLRLLFSIVCGKILLMCIGVTSNGNVIPDLPLYPIFFSQLMNSPSCQSPKLKLKSRLRISLSFTPHLQSKLAPCILLPKYSLHWLPHLYPRCWDLKESPHCVLPVLLKRALNLALCLSSFIFIVSFTTIPIIFLKCKFEYWNPFLLPKAVICRNKIK